MFPTRGHKFLVPIQDQLGNTNFRFISRDSGRQTRPNGISWVCFKTAVRKAKSPSAEGNITSFHEGVKDTFMKPRFSSFNEPCDFELATSSTER